MSDSDDVGNKKDATNNTRKGINHVKGKTFSILDY